MDNTSINVILAPARSGKSILSVNILKDMIDVYIKKKKQIPKIYFFSITQPTNNFIAPDFCFEFTIETFNSVACRDEEKIIILEDLLSQTTPWDLKQIDKQLSVHAHTKTHYIIINQTLKTLSVALRNREISSNVTLIISKQREHRIKDVFDSIGDCFDTEEQYREINNELEKYEFLKITPDNKYCIIKSDPKKIISIKKTNCDRQKIIK